MKKIYEISLKDGSHYIATVTTTLREVDESNWVI